MDTVQKLNQLDELHAHLALVNADYENKRAAILAPLHEQLTDLEEELAPIQSAISHEISTLETEIKEDVLHVGETVRGHSFMAVFAKGREGSWDSNKLKGFAMAHPEILAAKKPDGEPTVSIRRVG